MYLTVDEIRALPNRTPVWGHNSVADFEAGNYPWAGLSPVTDRACVFLTQDEALTARRDVLRTKRLSIQMEGVPNVE